MHKKLFDFRLPLLAAMLSCGFAVVGGGATHGAPVKSLLEMRQERVVVQNFDLSCAAAALATVLAYQYSDPVSESVIARALIRRPEYLANPDLVRYRQGFSLLDLKRYVESRGYEGEGYGELVMEDLAELAPVIVPVDLSGFPHFVVYRGARDGRVLLADPAYGNRTMRIERFEKAWIDSPQFGRVGFVVERSGGPELPNYLAPRPQDFVM